MSRFFLCFSKRADSVKLASLKQSQNLIARSCDAQRVTMGKKKQLRLLYRFALLIYDRHLPLNPYSLTPRSLVILGYKGRGRDTCRPCDSPEVRSGAAVGRTQGELQCGRGPAKGGIKRFGAAGSAPGQQQKKGGIPCGCRPFGC